MSLRIFDYIAKSLVFILFVALLQGLATAFATTGDNVFTIHLLSLFIGTFKGLSIAAILAVLACGNKWAKLALVIVNIILLDTYFFLSYRLMTSATPTVLMLVCQTNAAEAQGFFKTYFDAKSIIIMAFIALIAISAYLLAERWWQANWRHVSKSAVKWSKSILATLALIFAASVYANIMPPKEFVKNPGLWRHIYSSISIHRVPAVEIFDSYRSLMDKGQCIESMIRGNDEIQIIDCDFEAPHIIFIQGESHMKCHSAIYGYQHETEPNLKNELINGNLIPFTDVISSYRYTEPCNLAIYSISDINLSHVPESSPLFPAIIKKAGYNTYMLSNQNTKGGEGREGFASEFFLDDDTIDSQCFDYRNDKIYRYDHQLIDHWRDEIVGRGAYDATEPTFTIIHLYGQHFYASDRYPQNGEYDYFTADSIRRTDVGIDNDAKMQISQYDNATRYVDCQLKRIMDTYRDKEAVIVYLSDHGECFWDDKELTYLRKPGEERSLGALRAMHEVPFFVWCSDSYISNHPEKMAVLMAAAHKPITIACVGQILMDIAGIKSNFTDDTTNPLSQNFTPRHRIIENGGAKFDYDANRSLIDSTLLMSRFN